MLPIQSIEGPVPPRAPGSGPSLAVAASGAANENGEVRPQKPKTLPCKYCSKRFRRVEHVQRHERTHTKEKPFPCLWERCGKTFGRRDLLVRHEKLVHLNEGNKDNNRPRKSSTGAGHHASSSESHVETDMLGMPRPSQPQYHPDSMATGVATTLRPDPRAPSRAAACNLDLLSDAALASEVSPMQPIMAEMGQQSGGHSRIKSYDETMGYTERQREDPIVLSSGFAPQPQPPSYDDFNVFLDDFPGASNYLPPPFEVEHSIGMWSRNAELHHRNPSKPSSQFPSRFPSLQPDPRDPNDNSGRLHDEPLRAPPLRISAVDHSVIKNKLEEFSSVLPNDFVFPSRHTLTRFLDGYVGGFHEYLPFLHLPTLNPIEMAPELLLAVLAVGAQYRFESLRGYALWYAAKAVAMEQIRRRHSHEVHALLPTPAAYSPHSTRPSPSSGYRHSFASAQHDRPMTQDTHREPYSSNSDQARLETIQAVLLLFAVGLWGAKAILQEALSLQSQLAMLVREEGLTAETSQAAAPDWETWIRIEGITRTKLIAYCFFNLCSITYNVPPLILTSELNLYLPYPSRLWRAESSWQWQDARQNYPPLDITVHDAFARLFGKAPQGMPQGLPAHLSALGHYILIHALTQHVYLLKQTSFAASLPFDVQRGLKPEDTEEVTQALRIWQTSFDHRHQLRAAESGHFALGDSFPGGPVAFNSTALLRLAYIRLYTDIAVSRALETRNHVLVSEALNNMPLLVRSHRLHRAVFQAIHALSMLVRAGISYVARTKSLEWSIQHSLCNFECAILLSKWLLTLASVGTNEPPPTMEEKNLLEMVRRMLDETEFAVPIDPSLGGPAAAGGMDMAMNDGNKLRQLAVAVVRLWAETFKGSHIFEAVRVMGAALDGYADIMEKPRDRTPVARMGPDGVMG